MSKLDLYSRRNRHLHSLATIVSTALASVMHIFFWIILWLGLTAKRRWNFKLPPLDYQPVMATGAAQPLLMSPRPSRHHTSHMGAHGENGGSMMGGSIGEETIYWPKLTPSSPKLKVTFNDVPSTLSDNNLAEQDGKRYAQTNTQISQKENMQKTILSHFWFSCCCETCRTHVAVDRCAFCFVVLFMIYSCNWCEAHAMHHASVDNFSVQHEIYCSRC